MDVDVSNVKRSKPIELRVTARRILTAILDVLLA